MVDLPGIYSFDAASLDERVTRDYLLSRDADLVVNVVDAANLERNLYFSVQLLEMGVPLVVALNMMDVARKRGIEIDAQELSRRLGCPVVPIVATTGEGLSELQARMLAVADKRLAPGFPLALDEAVEQALLRLEPLLPRRRSRPIGAGWRSSCWRADGDAGRLGARWMRRSPRYDSGSRNDTARTSAWRLPTAVTPMRIPWRVPWCSRRPA